MVVQLDYTHVYKYMYTSKVLTYMYSMDKVPGSMAQRDTCISREDWAAVINRLGCESTAHEI